MYMHTCMDIYSNITFYIHIHIRYKSPTTSTTHPCDTHAWRDGTVATSNHAPMGILDSMYVQVATNVCHVWPNIGSHSTKKNICIYLRYTHSLRHHHFKTPPFIRRIALWQYYIHISMFVVFYFTCVCCIYFTCMVWWHACFVCDVCMCVYMLYKCDLLVLFKLWVICTIQTVLT